MKKILILIYYLNFPNSLQKDNSLFQDWIHKILNSLMKSYLQNSLIGKYKKYSFMNKSTDLLLLLLLLFHHYFYINFLYFYFINYKHKICIN
jgi:hypothetical protein